MTSEQLSPPSVLPCSVQPRVETSWLALPLSARGLVDELSNYTDENARIIVCLDKGTDFRAVGKEIARLLCAHRGELARVRSDTKKLMDDGYLAVDGAALRLSRIAHKTAARSIERPTPLTGAQRARLCRDRKKAELEAAPESSRNVTAVTEDRDDARDDRHDASVTRSLSLKEDLDLKSLKEREAVTASVTTQRYGLPEKLSDAWRAKAREHGLSDARTDYVWKALVIRNRTRKMTQAKWDELWEQWVLRRLDWDSEKSPNPNAVAQPFDPNATWLRVARGET
jgi:hypothetical protein